MNVKLIISTAEELEHIIKKTVAEELEHLIKKTVAEEFEKVSLSNTYSDIDVVKQSNLIYIEKASQLTGLALSTIRKKCHYGEMPYHKPKGTKRLVFKRDVLLSWMESGKQDVPAEVDRDRVLVFHPQNRKR